MLIDKELEEIFNDPLLDNINKEDVSLFDVPEELKSFERDKPDYYARRVICEDFSNYEHGFITVQNDLKQGKRSLQKFKTQALREGNYYISGGVLVYLEQISELKKEKNGTLNGRTRCIYENGTESDILLDTLRKSIYTDGYIITDNRETDEKYFEEKMGVTPDDKQDGWIYVLRSLSDNPDISNQKDLYKIGYSTTPVEKRIANAINDTTYLMDRVEIIGAWKTYNLNTQKLEALIHSFFNAVQFKMQLVDRNGTRYTAREWYVVPLGIIESVINRIIDGSIVHFRYNPSLYSLEELPEMEQDSTVEKYDTKGLKVLTLIIKQIYLDEILAETKKIEYRELKQNQLGKYTWVSNEDGKRYLKKYDLIRFFVGYNRNRQTALVEILDTTYENGSQFIEYHLGRILEK